MEELKDARKNELCQLLYDACKIIDTSSDLKNSEAQLKTELQLPIHEDDEEYDLNNHFQDMSEQEIVAEFYAKDSDQKLLKSKPWKSDPFYFQTVYVSALAVTKMTTHARSGGSIEIMGMLTGKIFHKCMVVLDCYPLPVEGTETRVNAQSELYEFMVQYLDCLKSTGRKEDIVGWYHSHPGYGCWLSGIDVATQELNQQFQDPYLAIVVDPERTLLNDRIEIGAFRTLPVDKDKKKSANANSSKKPANKNVPNSKLQDYGVHHDRYYALDVKLFQNDTDKLMINSFFSDETSVLVTKQDNELEARQTDSILQVAKKLNDVKFPNVVVNSFDLEPLQPSPISSYDPNKMAKKKTTPQQNAKRPWYYQSLASSKSKDSLVGTSTGFDSSNQTESEIGSEESEMDEEIGTRLESLLPRERSRDVELGDDPSVPVLEADQLQDQEQILVQESAQESQEPSQSRHVSGEIRQNISEEMWRIFKGPSLTEITADSGENAVHDLIKLLKLKVQENLFT